MTNKAIFLDRDGVINVDNGYVHQIDEFQFVPGVFEACRHIKAADYKLIIVTNQAGIARGYYNEEHFQILSEWMLSEFARNLVTIDGLYYCPHHPEKGLGKYKQYCHCRKPEPGMLLDAMEDHQIDPAQSYLIGDKVSDVQAGNTAGLKQSFLIKGKYDGHEQTDMTRFNNLLEVVQYLSLNTK